MKTRLVPVGAPAERAELRATWSLLSAPAGRCTAPAALRACDSTEWLAIDQPGTVAAALRDAGRWSLDAPERRLDGEDWWFRGVFDGSESVAAEEAYIGFDGLAGLVDVWLNGELLLRSDNMFVAHVLPLGGRLRAGGNELLMHFPSLDAALAQRRPRPRWRAPMVEHQQLRWFRTSLLGRLPGWAPPAPPIGPWRPVWIERRGAVSLRHPRVVATLDAHGRGRLEFSGELCLPIAARCGNGVLELDHAGRTCRAPVVPDAAGGRIVASLAVEAAVPWWPHTHGDPVRHALRLRIEVDGVEQVFELPPVGFRRIELDTAGDRFAVRVNGVPVFCRGACWMPLDPVGLRPQPAAQRAAVRQAREGGMNMLRVCGPTVYEDEAFLEACDAEGVLVWHDLMFANLDYPADDAAWRASVLHEVAQQLERWRHHPSVAVVCGNSEVEQQAAMWGAPRELWAPALFHAELSALCASELPHVPYWPSSAHGGAFPHQVDRGTSSYYGVGAYLRPLDDLRTAAPAFATECLGLANVPEPSTLARMPGASALRVHHPGWKARSPRDLGAGWDFDDVRDHYLGQIFGVDPLHCRRVDHERYLVLSRIVSGELMARAFSEWRRPGSGCGGALVWFLRDLWAGAGWGLLDDCGLPKAAWHALRRALQPVALLLTDEGLNGVTAHVINEPVRPLRGRLQVCLYGGGDALLRDVSVDLQVAGHACQSVPLASLLDGFVDMSFAYRFGPPPVGLVHARLLDENAVVQGEAFYQPAALWKVGEAGTGADPGLSARFVTPAAGPVEVEVSTQRFARSVYLDVPGCRVADNHFHLAPGACRRVALDVGAAVAVLRGEVGAGNAARPAAIRSAS